MSVFIGGMDTPLCCVSAGASSVSRAFADLIEDSAESIMRTIFAICSFEVFVSSVICVLVIFYL